MYLAHQAVHKPLGLPPEGVFSEDELSLLKAIEANSDDSGHLRKRFAKVLNYSRGRENTERVIVRPVRAATCVAPSQESRAVCDKEQDLGIVPRAKSGLVGGTP